MKMKKISWIVVGVLSTIIGLYPIMYFLTDQKFGILSSKSAELLSDSLWNISFYGHIVFGGLALLIGWLQFNHKWRRKKASLHRTIGKAYVIFVLISGICGLFIAQYVAGGTISMLGFSMLGITWLGTTIAGFKAIKQGNVGLHEKLMLFSYAACFSAVTLRLWLPMLVSVTDDFAAAYRIVSWLCWVPNIIIAYFIVRSKSKVSGYAGG